MSLHADAQRRASLPAELKARLDAGEHERVAAELADADPNLAAWILEQIWDFASARQLHLRAGALVEALRCAIEADDATGVEHDVAALERSGGELAAAGAELLTSRRRHEAAARLLAAVDAAPEARASALVKAGDDLAAARVLFDAGEARAALDRLGSPEARAEQAPRWALAARAWWVLGDAEAAARAAQVALRWPSGLDAAAEAEGAVSERPHESVEEMRSLLARALEALGHPDAAEVALVLGQDSARDSDNDRIREAAERIDDAGGHGRYHVHTTHPAPLAGAAYLALDRVTHREVELHLLLAEQQDGAPPDLDTLAAVRRFIQRATAASKTRHPAIRRVLRAEAEDGLLVLPRADGPTLRSMIRPPGLGDRPARARAIIAFLAEGLAAVHALGQAHGGVLPHLIVTDALGRPLLGPAGVDELSGLAATRTGGLEELLSLTAPELRGGQAATPEGDVFALGGIWAALLAGQLRPALDELPESARPLIRRMTKIDPSTRPRATDLIEPLRRPVRDLRELEATSRVRPGESSSRSASDLNLSSEHVIQVSAEWSEHCLEQLCGAVSPWIQSILDRDGRSFWLAAWPEGSARLEPGADPWALLDARALSGMDPEAAAEVRAGLVRRPDAVVQTRSGEWIIALDLLLV